MSKLMVTFFFPTGARLVIKVQIANNESFSKLSQQKKHCEKYSTHCRNVTFCDFLSNLQQNTAQ